MWGTKYYRAPELEKEPYIATAASDFWSLGCVVRQWEYPPRWETLDSALDMI